MSVILDKKGMINDNGITFVVGIIAGTVATIFLNFILAILTAFLCGMAGIAGKQFYQYAARKFFKRNKGTAKDSNTALF